MLRREVLERRLDLAVLTSRHPDTELVSIPVVAQRVVAIVARDHPWAARRDVSLSEVAALPLVMRERGSTTRLLFEEALRAAGLGANIRLELGTREAVKEAVALGIGGGVLLEAELGGHPGLHPLKIADGALDAAENIVLLDEYRELAPIARFLELAASRFLKVAPEGDRPGLCD